MPNEKITISTDEVHSQKIDIKIKHQDLINRAQQHYQQAVPPPAAAGKASFFQKAFVYMTLFGLIGGIFAWGVGECILGLGTINYYEKYVALHNLEVQNRSDMESQRISNEVGEERENQIVEQLKMNPYYVVETDSNLTDQERDQRFKEMLSHDWWVEHVFWASVALILALFLATAESLMSRNLRGVLINGTVGALLGFIGGLVLSLFIDRIYNALGGGGSDTSLGAKQMLARTIGWGIVGLFLGIAPGIVMRSFKKTLLGLVGGLIGGLLGGLLFDPIANWTDSGILSRFVGIVAIGVIAGLATALIEQAAKTGWLKVVAGLIAGKQFILYRNPTNIGSSPSCEIYLFKDPQIGPRHAAIHVVGTGYELEDLNSGFPTFVNGRQITRTRLRSGDQIQIGSSQFAFAEKDKTYA